MSRHESRHPRCKRCGKASYLTYREAQRAAKEMTRLSGKASGVIAYWDKSCQTFHVGGSTQGAYRRARRT